MNLDDLRKDIDEVDEEIITLLSKRISLIKEVGKLKNKVKQSIYHPDRELQIINRLNKINQEKDLQIPPKAIEALYFEIFALSRYLEKAENIAYLGPKGSFTHIAAQSRFGSLASYLPFDNIDDVFDALKRKIVKYAVLPVENSNQGIVFETIDNLGQSDAKIIGELDLQIKQSLASKAKDLAQIDKIYSKDIAYLQCKNTLKRYNLDKVKFIPISSTAKAATLASQDENSAAICSNLGAKINKLPILIDNLQDNLNNKTRFIILSDFKTKASYNDKTSILLKLKDDKTGNLRQALSIFEEHNINLYKIESRPIKDGNFSYQFFIDFAGHIDEQNVQNAFKSFKDVKWLGSYPKSLKV